jgi:Leucine-rich repeat (LRR) protein
MSILAKLPKLRTLSLSTNLITYIPEDPEAKVISKHFKNLNELDISFNMIANENDLRALCMF